MYKPIAVIGISFELPGMKDWAELSQSLTKKETCIGALPPGRLQDVHNQYGPLEMSTGGFLAQIDLFDNAYFDLTDREAIKAFPEHRLFLLHALRAFYDAGYTAKDIRQSDTGIFLAPAKSLYTAYLNGQYDFVDTLTGIEATRLARFLDIRGPVMSVNTTCSSSLMAMHNACSSLEQKECSMVLVGGVRIGTITRERAETFAIMSRKGACRPFDKEADGTMNGEGAICMVLKRLEDAERDNDPIYATIEGSAVNHSGARISSLTAPSIEAQKEVILKAWEYAGIAPKDIKFIEAHGTGTILGDPIEFAGINEAFVEKGISATTCRISSVKAQIGHLDTMCGMAGLLRVIAALNNKIIPPQANFAAINEHIEESDSVIRVQREAEYWETDNGLRVGGVSSFGLTGTNVHMVIAHREGKIQTKNPEQPHFLQISETTKERLGQLKEQLIQFLENDPSTNLGAFSQKINRLYTAGKYNEGIIFADRGELLQELRRSADKPVEEAAFLLMDLDLLSYDQDLIKKILEENSIIKKCWEDVIGKTYFPEHIADNTVLSVLFQYVLYKYLSSLLGNKLQVVTKQGEGVLQALLNNKLQPAAIINDPGLISINRHPFNRQNFESYLFKNFRQQKVVLIDFSGDNEMHFPDAGNVINICGAFHAKERYQLYKELLAVNKEPLKVPNVPVLLPGIQLPVYQLSRFWPQPVPKAGINNGVVEKTEKIAEQPVTIISLEEISTRVKPIWKKILEQEGDIAPTDDFFELGGDSLSGLDMLSLLSKEFKGNFILYEEMFSYSRFENLCGRLHENMTRSADTVAAQQADTKNAADGVVAIDTKDIAIRDDKYRDLLADIQNGPVPDRIVPGDILITGSTGFIGSFLVKSILDTTDANIICMARDKKGRSAHDRFWEVFEDSFGISSHERIKIVSGDLRDKDLFNDWESQQLLANVNRVYHAAGSPAFVGNPNLEEQIAFKGTKRIFDWVLSNKVQYFNHVSTIGVTGNGFPPHIKNFYETDLNLGQNTKDYIHSAAKLMAEEYIHAHRTPGINVNIFRILNAGGRYNDGFTRLNMDTNLMYMKLKKVSKVGFYSNESLAHNLNFRVIPVDLLMEVICDLSSYQHKYLNTFHLSFEKGFSMREIIDTFNENGIKMAKLDDDTFREYMKKWEENSEEYAVKLVKHGIYDNAKVHKVNPFSFKNEATRLTLDKIKSNVTYDRLTYLKNVVGYCVKKGFLRTDNSFSQNVNSQ